MKKTAFLFSFLILISLNACKNNSESTKIINSSTTEKKIEVIDPNPSDSIPAELYGINSSNGETAQLVRLTLQEIYKEDLSKNSIDEISKKFIFFEFDLNEDEKKEIFVGLIGSYFCGTGGCTQYILDYNGIVISKFTVSDYPIVIDTNKSNGWRNLFIPSGGKNRILKFNGKSYPSNPSLEPELKEIPGDGLPRALFFMNEPYPWFNF
ncbi:hypothetical protein [Flavobacterium sp.]|uniref:hypothetical protein n=1 Tax=Flavobacterium sp. TaxID=239 RepID=UPI0025BAEF09|nr:hypothetical protein [Flavobacterium sp.]MBA4153827.1 hypothetical protein [Flavobacterium sp.]